jgi:hypothetical protein
VSPFSVGLGPDERRTKAIERLSALHEAGHQYVLITSVLRWLGEEVSPDADTEPITVQPARVEIDPADPLAALGLADPRA